MTLNEVSNKVSKGKALAYAVKAITGVVGGSLVLTEGHPYIAITVLAIGAAANEMITVFGWNK